MSFTVRNGRIEIDEKDEPCPTRSIRSEDGVFEVCLTEPNTVHVATFNPEDHFLIDGKPYTGRAMVTRYGGPPDRYEVTDRALFASPSHESSWNLGENKQRFLDMVVRHARAICEDPEAIRQAVLREKTNKVRILDSTIVQQKRKLSALEHTREKAVQDMRK
jgi:hypothetical protein